MRACWFAAAALAVVAAAGSAEADVPARALVRRIVGSSPERASRLSAVLDASGRIPVLTPLPDGVRARDLGLLPVAPGFGAIRLPPEQVEAFSAAYPELMLSVGPPRRPLLDESQGWTGAGAYREQTGLDGSGVVVGVIDTGLDVRHPDFRNADGTTRVAWLLRSGTPRNVHADVEAAFGCNDPNQSPCAVYDRADIDALLLDPNLEAPRDLQGHGTHVTSIAAGNGGAMTFAIPEGTLGGPCPSAGACTEGACETIEGAELCTIECESSAGCPETTRCRTISAEIGKRCMPKTPRYLGVAPGATIVAAAPSSGAGFHDPDILNAASFVFDRAAALGMPAVLNLSVGGDFGPHDGTSPLEKGLAALVGDDKPGRAIVVAAGNSGSLFFLNDGSDALGVHTEARAYPSAVTRVPMHVAEASDGQGFVWITFRPGDEISVGLEGPDGETWIGLVDHGDDAGYESDGNTAAVVNAIANGKSAITPDTNSAVVYWSGKWKGPTEFAVLLSGHGDAQLWVVGTGDLGGGSPGALFRKGIKQGTINVPASHPSLLAVGCTVNRLSWKPLGTSPIEIAALGTEDAPQPDGICYFSSAGPTPFGVAKPEISAPGGFVAAAMSSDSDPRKVPGGLFDAPGCPTTEPCFVVDETHAITAGTSMSAPHVAGAIALLLQRDPSLTQARITDVLQAGARRPLAPIPHDYQLGPGELDILGAVAALGAETVGTGAPPDITRSWYALSSGYARPDPTWPVWGTVELRHADGSIATGLDGTRLALRVTGGRVYQPLTKVRHGLWRFAVTGEPGKVGGEVVVDVAYDGQSIGAPRHLPIGSDVWTAREGFDGLGGGCACDTAGSRRGSPPWTLALLALAAIALRTARRDSPRRHGDTEKKYLRVSVSPW